MNTPYIIGIAGGTGSGKTTIAQQIVSHFQNKILHIPHDRYYNDQSSLSMEERVKTNYDHPNSLETNLLIQHLKELTEGKSVQMPEYDFTTHTRKPEMTTENPAPLILVEGILIYENQILRDLMEYKIFVDVPADVRVLRRIKRDIEERGRTLESCTEQYFSTILPMHDAYVEPSKKYADILVPHGGKNMKAIETLIAFLEKRLVG